MFSFSDFRFFFVSSSFLPHFPPFFHIYLLIIFTSFALPFSIFFVSEESFPLHHSCLKDPTAFYLYTFYFPCMKPSSVPPPQVLEEAYLLIPAHSGYSITCKVLPKPPPSSFLPHLWILKWWPPGYVRVRRKWRYVVKWHHSHVAFLRLNYRIMLSPLRLCGIFSNRRLEELFPERSFTLLPLSVYIHDRSSFSNKEVQHAWDSSLSLRNFMLP